MQDDHAIKELLNAKEGEQVQFKVRCLCHSCGNRLLFFDLHLLIKIIFSNLIIKLLFYIFFDSPIRHKSFNSCGSSPSPLSQTHIYAP